MLTWRGVSARSLEIGHGSLHLNFAEKILFMISEIMGVFVVAKLSYIHFEELDF
jgi:hypothetical protein